VIIKLFMKQYVIDELRAADYKALHTHLDEHYGPAVLDGIYWIPIDTDQLTDIQREHRECRPHCFAVELEQNRLACELLVRTHNRVRCDCIRYATETQLVWMIALIDNIFRQLKIIT
jgi:hypothetical protein